MAESSGCPPLVTDDYGCSRLRRAAQPVADGPLGNAADAPGEIAVYPGGVQKVSAQLHIRVQNFIALLLRKIKAQPYRAKTQDRRLPPQEIAAIS